MVAETTGGAYKIRKNSPTFARGVVGHAHFPNKKGCTEHGNEFFENFYWLKSKYRISTSTVPKGFRRTLRKLMLQLCKDCHCDEIPL